MPLEMDELRAELRSWLNDHPPPTSPAAGAAEELPAAVAAGRRWQALLAKGRWVGVTWPRAYGGRALGPLASFVVTEELARAGAPELTGRVGVNLVGPTLLAHGNDDQRQRWLPAILPARELWCQLYSEPEAGSDLAGLATRAERDGTGWRVTGTKVWTSYAQFADWGVCLARSDPGSPRRQDGITCFAVDMHAPGVTVRPLVQLTGDAEFNEVVLDGVFVGDANRIGAPGEGWTVAATTLAHERGINPRQLGIHMRLLASLLACAHDRPVAFADWRTRRRLADAFIGVRIFELHNLRSLARLARGDAPGPEGSTLKLYWSEMSQRLNDTALAVLGPQAPLWQGAHGNPGDGAWQRAWLYSRATTIFSGTSEIQRDLIAERVLGLPREPAAGKGAR